MSNTAEKYLDNVSNELSVMKEYVDINKIAIAKDIIINAENNNKRVHVTGIGKPSYVAGYISSLLASTGTPTYFLHGTEAVHGSAGQVQEGDVVIAISNSGETEELKYTIKTVKENGAKIISVSRSDASWLAQNSDVHLLAKVSEEGDTLNKAPRTSILMELIQLQILSIMLQEEKNLTNEEYVKWHPGGALGKSIRGDK